MDIPLPYRILAVDPATTTSGWAMLEVTSLNPLNIIVHKTNQIEGQKLLREKKEMSKLFSKQFCVVDALEHEYIQLINEWNPHEVVSEGAFAHIHISAALALTLAIHALRRACYQTLGKDIIIVPPTITKLAFTGKGNADKDLMRYHFNNNDYLDISTQSEDISEHQIDACGHGVGHVRRDVVGDVIQISALEKRQAKREKEKLKQEKMKS
jgi:Holliday junction resolvasome RuvABC endonuclease subunit